MMSRMVAPLMVIAGLGLLAGCGKNGQSAAPGRLNLGDNPAAAAADPLLPGPVHHVLALGDSLFAGYGLRSDQAYPQQLEAALRARAINVRVTNAGVSGDTTADGLARLNFTLGSQPQPPELVLICLGGNDMLRGLPPAETRANLAAILAQLQQRHVPVLLMGMLAAPNLGKAYVTNFNAIYPALAAQYHAALVPFFLRAVIDRPNLRQADHIHPTASGVGMVVNATLPAVAKALTARAIPGPNNTGRFQYTGQA